MSQEQARAPSGAGLLRRLASICYDLLIVSALLIAATAAILPLTRGNAISAGTLWFQLYVAGIVLLYFAGFWWRSGQTIGMVAWRLRVVADSGGRATLTQCVLRGLMAVVSLAALGLGFFWALFDRHGRTWHDRVSRTRLIFLRRPDEDPFSERAPAPPR